MIKLAKWAFKLGQQTERQRISGILNSTFNHTGGREAWSKKFEPEVEKAVRNEVRRRVDNIVHEITKTSSFEEKYFSVLFPKEDK